MSAIAVMREAAQHIMRLRENNAVLTDAIRAYLALVDGRGEISSERVTAMTAQMRAALARVES